VQHLATYTEVGESPEEASAEDPRQPLPADMAAEAAGEEEGAE
jgi:hypothetical protein